MKCILLCAGYATRLFPITENFPKALIEVGGKPIIDYILEEVNEVNEVDEIFVVTNNKYYTHFNNWATEKNNVKSITVFNDQTLTNDDRLGAIGDTVFTIDKANIDDDIMVVATDNLFEMKIKDMVEYFNIVKKPCVCVKKESRELLTRLGVADLDENNKVLSFEEKPAEPKGDYAVWAIYLYPKNTLPMYKSYIDEGYASDAPGNFVKYLVEKSEVFAFPFEGNYFDIGTHETLNEVKKIYENK